VCMVPLKLFEHYVCQSVALILLYPLRPELVLQSGHNFTRSMVVQPSLFDSAQPACASAAE
jgi:hypothetical protein